MADWRVGLFLHTHEGKDIQYQCRVLREVGEGGFEIQFFSWMDGRPTNRQVVPVSWFDEHKSTFYPTDREMVAAYAKEQGRNPDEELEVWDRMGEIFGNDPKPAVPRQARKDKSHLRAMSKKLRFKIFKRDHFTCTYCARRAGPGVELEIDHVIPLAKGGKDEESNLTTSCHECNRGKRDTKLDA